jgi:hypothetical protein
VTLSAEWVFSIKGDAFGCSVSTKEGLSDFEEFLR